jgi:hypothetical protein
VQHRFTQFTGKAAYSIPSYSVVLGAVAGRGAVYQDSVENIAAFRARTPVRLMPNEAT